MEVISLVCIILVNISNIPPPILGFKLKACYCCIGTSVLDKMCLRAVITISDIGPRLKCKLSRRTYLVQYSTMKPSLEQRTRSSVVFIVIIVIVIISSTLIRIIVIIAVRRSKL